MKIVILAGGGGTRLWPLCRQDKPKQFSRLLREKTMFEETVDRFSGAFGWENIFVCLNQRLLPKARELAPQISADHFIVEPSRRDTGPAMGLVAAYLADGYPNEPVAFIPSDHFIADKEKFLRIIKTADELIRRTGKMVDIAVQPTFPSTVLGYTRLGRQLDFGYNEFAVCEFLGHTEKPKFEIAKQYLESGDYWWHASYYMWTPAKILSAFTKHRPADYEHLAEIAAAFNRNDKKTVDAEFEKLEKISFDYAVTEKIDPSEVLIVKGDFGWSDVGAFDVLYEAQKNKVDENGNLAFGNYLAEESSDCLVYGHGDKLIATVGLNDFVVVDTDDALLICPKSKAQDIKKIAQRLEQENKNKYL